MDRDRRGEPRGERGRVREHGRDRVEHEPQRLIGRELPVCQRLDRDRERDRRDKHRRRQQEQSPELNRDGAPERPEHVYRIGEMISRCV